MQCNYTLSLPKDRMPEGYRAPSAPVPCGAFTTLTALYIRACVGFSVLDASSSILLSHSNSFPHQSSPRLYRTALSSD